MISEREVIENIKFLADINNVSIAEELVERICNSQGVSEDAFGNVLIAVTEAVNNAIIHGSNKDVSKEVTLSVYKSNEGLEFEVADTGNGFDFNNLEDPTDPKNIEKPNGRGIFLMQNLADDVEYFVPGNKVRLEFKLN